jgi:hypothetical protein
LLLADILLPATSVAAVQPLFDLRAPSSAPFPSNRFAVTDRRHLTGLRVNLPKPDCAQRPSDCNDIAVLNTLDGFNMQPRLSIPFSGPIDPKSVNSSNVFLIRMGDAAFPELPNREVVGINQIVWDPASNTLFAESNELLDQHANYLLVVTDGVRDASGAALTRTDFLTFANDPSNYRFADSSTAAYRTTLLNAIATSGVASSRIVAASIFTTLSATAELEKIRNQIKARIPAPADFVLQNGTRTVFPFSTVQAITASRQVGTAPSFRAQPLQPLTMLSTIPNSVGTIAFGSFISPLYQNAQQYIPATGTATGVPVVQRNQQVIFTLILPAGPKPPFGWPVAIYGPGYGTEKDTIVAFSSVMAAWGVATIAINIPGHGGGPLGTLTVTRTNGTSVTLPAGGRAVDQNADGMFAAVEGMEAVAPYNLLGFRDGMRQTVVDLMQLTRVIETGGFDVNGDGLVDLDRSRIYSFGISLGGMYGPMLMAVEPALRSGVANVGGSSVIEVARLGAFRGIPALALATRTPSLLNAGAPQPPAFGFNDNMPLRNEPVRINTVPGAIAIQDFFERWEWASQSGDPLAYAPHIIKRPLSGVSARPFLVQFSRGDRTVPNPSTSAFIRAGGLESYSTYFRTDLAVAADPNFPKDPHTLLGRLTSVATADYAIASQDQIGLLFASNGTLLLDPGALFEVPIVGSLPEGLNFLP